MNLKSIRCRDHGGTFEIPAVRGRPPVRCGGKYPSCSSVAQNGGRKRKAPNEIASEIKNERLATAVTRDDYGPEATRERKSAAQTAPTSSIAAYEATPEFKARRKAVDARSQANPCVDMAYKSRELLEPLGWVVAVKGWMDPESMETYATLTASRDTELMTLVWQGGKLTDQQYSIWDTEVPSANGKPKTDASYLPEFDEMTDREIVQRLSGMAVEWWNRIGQSVERAVIPGKLQIEHVYSGSGDETPADRVIKFIDHNGTGFRAFRLGALMKVGKGK